MSNNAGSSISFCDMLNNPQYYTKKQLRPHGSERRARPPKLNSKRKSNKSLQSTPPLTLMNCENDNLSNIFNESINLSYFDQCFENPEKIGEGSFGEVYKVKFRENGEHYAVKISKVSFRGECDREGKVSEVRNYESVPQHENIITLINAWEQDDFVYLQMELGAASLDQYMEDCYGLTDQQLWNVLLDMLLALKHLHDNNLIHLDVKLENIIVTETGVCKLGDFGLLVNLKDPVDLRNAVEGDAKYLAVELMEGKFSKAADVFSLGISMLELATDLDLPSNGQLWHNLRNLDFPDHMIKDVPKDFINIIRRMMNKNYKRRPSIKTLMKHPRLQRMMKQRKIAKEEGRDIEGRIIVLEKVTPFPNGLPVTPPNNGRLGQRSVQSTPPSGYSSANLSMLGQFDSAFRSPQARDFEPGRHESFNPISSTPYLEIPTQRKCTKHIFFSSAKKLNFVNDM